MTNRCEIGQGSLAGSAYFLTLLTLDQVTAGWGPYSFIKYIRQFLFGHIGK